MDGLPFLQSDFLFQKDRDIAADSDEAQASDLYQGQNDQLSEQAPVLIGIRHHQTGHAGGRGGRKQGVQKGHPFPAAGGNREA